MKNRNTILLLLALILFGYTFVKGFLPSIYNHQLRTTFIPEIERLTQLRINYSSAKMSINPLLGVKLVFKNVVAEKKDVLMPVASAGTIEMQLGPSVLFTKKYNLKSMLIRGATYHEVIYKGSPEITSFLEQYSLLPVAGQNYTVKACPIAIKYLIKTSYNAATQKYSERKYTSYDIDEGTVERFLMEISQGRIKTIH